MTTDCSALRNGNCLLSLGGLIIAMGSLNVQRHRHVCSSQHRQNSMCEKLLSSCFASGTATRCNSRYQRKDECAVVRAEREEMCRGNPWPLPRSRRPVDIAHLKKIVPRNVARPELSTATAILCHIYPSPPPWMAGGRDIHYHSKSYNIPCVVASAQSTPPSRPVHQFNKLLNLKHWPWIATERMAGFGSSVFFGASVRPHVQLRLGLRLLRRTGPVRLWCMMTRRETADCAARRLPYSA